MSRHPQRYFFCGVGGSGMAPLALFLRARGAEVSGSDRARDQGATPEKFAAIEEQGIRLFPQDGGGVKADEILVVSSAIEPSIPEVAAAQKMGIPIRKRAEILAGLFNQAETSIGVAGTSGKSSVTGMIAVMLAENGMDPSVMNGGTMIDFGSGMRAGGDAFFVAEMDESDGSIALFNPSVAVLNNITLDHKSFDELEVYFGEFLGRAKKACVLNFDDLRVRALAKQARGNAYSYALNGEADLRGEKINFHPDGVSFVLNGKDVHLKVPGRHNVSNALAAIGAGLDCGLTIEQAIKGVERFSGVKRRLETVGTKNGVTVIDDFGHNPDKIAAGLATLKEFDGRLIVVFQPHGFGPMKLMGREIIDAFSAGLGKGDALAMPEIYYAGGTAERSVTSKDMIKWAQEKGVNARWFEKRADILPFILSEAKEGDRVVVMGARDDSLTEFAKNILAQL